MFGLFKINNDKHTADIVMQCSSKTCKDHHEAYEKFKSIANDVVSMNEEEFFNNYSINYLDMISLGDNVIPK